MGRPPTKININTTQQHNLAQRSTRKFQKTKIQNLTRYTTYTFIWYGGSKCIGKVSSHDQSTNQYPLRCLRAVVMRKLAKALLLFLVLVHDVLKWLQYPLLKYVTLLHFAFAAHKL